MFNLEWNNSVLCVDDEEGILEAYRKTLSKNEVTSDDIEMVMSRRRSRLGQNNSKEPARPDKTNNKSMNYNILTATNGEDAVKIVRNEIANGRQIAVGYFDMVMPGGIDGRETIRQILDLDDHMLCAVVTAYTDRLPAQLSDLFPIQDQWLYFNKPFSMGELVQTTCNLVTSWNRRRREKALISNLEMMQNGLLDILKAIKNINKAPPLMIENLLHGILSHYLILIDAQDGFLSLTKNETSTFQKGLGKFSSEKSTASFENFQEWKLAEKALNEKKSVLENMMAATPLKIDSEILGVIFAQKDSVIKKDIKLLEMFAAQAVNILQSSMLFEELENRNLELNRKNQELLDLIGKLAKTEKIKKKLLKLSYIDKLTGIPNRLYFDQRSEEELMRSKRYKLHFSCLMIDIDHFKTINDTYGHLAGDCVLSEMGKLFRKHKRDYDIFGRYGGEEFALILVDIEQAEVYKFSERLRRYIEKHTTVYEGNEISVTISVGITTLIPSENDTINSILKLADEALYVAKKNGRNRSHIQYPQ